MTVDRNVTCHEHADLPRLLKQAFAISPTSDTLSRCSPKSTFHVRSCFLFNIQNAFGIYKFRTLFPFNIHGRASGES